MPSFNIELSEAQKLFLVWFFLFYHQKEDWEKDFDGKYVPLGSGASDGIGSYKIKDYLRFLYQEKIITSCYIWQYKESTEETDKAPHETIDTLFLIAPKKTKNLDKEILFEKEIPEIGSYGDFRYYDLYAEIHEKKAKQYISEYLNKWENNELYLLQYNILRKEEQLKQTLLDIFLIIEKHSHKNFLIHETEGKSQNEIDFIASILFLEKIGSIFINGFLAKQNNSYGEATIHFRISLTEKFFEDFSYNKEKKEVIFNFTELQTPNKNQKKIFFDMPFRLWDKKTEYRINRGKFPFELLNASFDELAINSVSIDVLLEVLQVSREELSKAIDNFRRNLREKFSFPEHEKFFSVQDEEILLDSRIFKKKQKEKEKA